MIISQKGKKIVAAIPQNRILTETDGPFVTINKRMAEPADVRLVEEHLAQMWNVTPLEARATVASNFRALTAALWPSR